MTFVAVCLIAVGLAYIVKPGIFRGGFSPKTDIAQRNLSPAHYTQYLRGLGFLFVVLGAALLLATW